VRPRPWILLLVPLGMGLALSIPSAEPRPAPAPTHGRSFAWNEDTLWRSLEARYVAARALPCDRLAKPTRDRRRSLDGVMRALARDTVAPADPRLDSLQLWFFDLAPVAAVCPAALAPYVTLANRMRAAIKRQSRHWDVTRSETRDRLYRSLYGARAAVEEAMLQQAESAGPALVRDSEPSATPAALVHGVEIHSGDILVSRGGYPTSALIARGNDYPGNFSHIGLVYVDSATHAASVIEAHIEQGVAVATAEQYLEDKKLRIMVLRPRADLPALQRDPLLPHRAATLALERATSGHIAYDFEMDYTDPSKLFCSEVASSAYHDKGVDLWMGISTISRPGLRRWLAAFGVRHFETEEPSDLEYDPQLVVVAEWRDPATLYQDHVDNAVIDAMLEGADRGDRLTFPWYALAPARVLKTWSWILERLGRTGPVPEGMSSAAALRHRAFSARQRVLAREVAGRAAALERQRGYRPPFWTLEELARATLAPAARARSPSE
jgi:Permuted papain-like amidase enzyme, YaeF/YiiX, C92 family